MDTTRRSEGASAAAACKTINTRQFRGWMFCAGVFVILFGSPPAALLSEWLGLMIAGIGGVLISGAILLAPGIGDHHAK